jgi:hypothetical protein
MHGAQVSQRVHEFVSVSGECVSSTGGGHGVGD